MPTTYVRKIVSLSPDKYALVRLEDAIEGYGEYCISNKSAGYEQKSFIKWLDTEI